ncbi:fumarylacetoacetate hydrolase family protein [Fontisubflavum oceani]|uniref:fumarylacetoacetate hydrolase family protein n=1 Tax=Fontisubflavum oceani TaxID=2978973 RepID=UPI0025B5D1F8|nr:fumarylacetoacetate hydrolase family protein [Fontisubflavum oceani]WJY21400.1 fumarylacetoacetate hydrolase family protein [Fontisubflavum oceani]
MRFVRYGAPGMEKPGVLDAAGQVRDLSGQVADLGGGVLTRLPDLTADGPLVPGAPRLGPPLTGIGKIICIGLNYADHAAETGATPPPEPLIFMKATSAITGPNDTIYIPRGSAKTDWEVELGVVIGKPAKHVTEAEALNHVAGYVAVNDVSERDFQKHRAGQWTKGKSCDSFAPIGPWLVTPDEVGDPQKLGLRLRVNGETRQDGSTEQMIFGVPKLISYLSDFFTLQPGDIIATGTPPGVGAGMTPPVFLAPGDEITLEIDGLGQQNMTVEAG